MKRIAIITISLVSLFCLSGCIEISYKADAKLTIGKKRQQIARPTIVDDGYPIQPESSPAVYASLEELPNTPAIRKEKSRYASLMQKLREKNKRTQSYAKYLRETRERQKRGF